MNSTTVPVHEVKNEAEESDRLSSLSLKYHAFYRGKVQLDLKCPITSTEDFAVWYTPGVAKPSLEIAEDQELSYEYTNRGNLIAIVSDGSRVLGLGRVGPHAALPVMEGKSLLYKYLGGIDAFPVVLSTETAKELTETVLFISPSFGGVNLEDIEAPKCFFVLEELRKRSSIPVWHDDQQGTATVIMAALTNALKVVGKKLRETKITLIGAGAASLATARLLEKSGFPLTNLVVCDSSGILHPEREDMDRLQLRNPWKYELSMKTNGERRRGGIGEALSGADVCISAAAPGPGLIRQEWVRGMNRGSIVFALANPIPEIWPREAKEAGAEVVATGRSDFPNQVNNSLVFPAVFRGTLDVRANSITDEMCLAAASSLATYASLRGIKEDHIIPTMDEWEAFPEEAAAVGVQAMSQGLARVKLSRSDLLEMAKDRISRARERVKLLMKAGLIHTLPK
jgi:malate dehydrogenase (oxaloacetate-decarboxylating)